MKKYNGKATVVKSGDVTTIRVVDYHGVPPTPAPPSPITETPTPNREELDSLKHVDIIAFAQAAEQEFIRLLEFLLNEMPGGVPVIGLRAESAFKLGISTQTAKRYIEKYCYSYSSSYKILDGKVIRKVGDDEHTHT